MKIEFISVGYHSAIGYKSIADVNYTVWVYYPTGRYQVHDFKNEGQASAFVGKTLKRRKDVNIVVYTPCALEIHDYGLRFPPMMSVRHIDLAYMQNFDIYPSSIITTKTK